MVIGLTGKYCAGKNVAARVLEQRGFFVIDEDLVGHEVLESESQSVIKGFGTDILDNDGRISRQKLGAVVFNNREKLELLESILHPLMVHKTKELLAMRKQEHAAVNAAVLFKMELHKICDFVITINAPFVLRIHRAMQRDKQGLIRAFQRIWSQRSLNKGAWNVDRYSVCNVWRQSSLAAGICDILEKRGLRDQ
jgi:dephospho-CoA kinase